MDLKKIKGLGPAKAQKLAAAGIDSLEALARADPEEVANKADLPVEQVKEFKHRAAALSLIEDLKGVGPESLDTLSQAGKESLRNLYSASADWLEAELKLVRNRLASLQAKATDVAHHIAEESRTPEGRKRLAKETSDLARKTAADAKVAGQEALVKAQKAAREIERRAPMVMKQAEAKVKAAETKVREAAAKAEKTLRVEAEKARARAENALDRAKSRFK
jgi:nucleotidyltransferase/DNA polymerase involved in DNA repair